MPVFWVKPRQLVKSESSLPGECEQREATEIFQEIQAAFLGEFQIHGCFLGS